MERGVGQAIACGVGRRGTRLSNRVPGHAHIQKQINLFVQAKERSQVHREEPRRRGWAEKRRRDG